MKSPANRQQIQRAAIPMGRSEVVWAKDVVMPFLLDQSTTAAVAFPEAN
jgi:hypothetical protein